MNSFWKGFCNLFGCCFSPKTLNESMGDLYSRMGWGTYPYSYCSTADINRVLEAEQQFVDSINDYVYDGTFVKKNLTLKDPSRPRISQCYGRQRYK